MKVPVRLVFAALLVVSGAVVGAQAPAWSARHTWCKPVAERPYFVGDTIKGKYGVDCLVHVNATKVVGRIKEDRPKSPDIRYKTQSYYFTYDSTDFISYRTCQDGDAIYIESEIPDSPGEDGETRQSARREMHC
jgi:hypothetical protein